MKVGINQVEVFTRSLPHYVAPTGQLMKQSDFFKLDRTLGFKMINVK